MSFKIASRFRQAAAAINNIPLEKFPLLLNRVIQKVSIRNVRLFSEEEEGKLRSLFELSNEDLKLILDGCCYIFEQSAFASIGPEPLYEILLEAGFDEPHGKVIGRLWAAEAAGFIGKLKARTLGNNALLGTDYHLNLTMSDSTTDKMQEPRAIFELSVGKPSDVGVNTNTTMLIMYRNAIMQSEDVIVEFDHSELFTFFTQLERIQQQLDSLS